MHGGIHMKINDKICDLRKKAGWSQEQLAEKIEVSRQAVSKWESGQSLPDIEKVVMLADIFHVSTDYLLRDGATETKQAEEIISRPRKSSLEIFLFPTKIKEAIWILLPMMYLVISFITNGWDWTWLIWIIAIPVILVIELFSDDKAEL